ncbi:MAG TPA: molecular chaperone DnaK [Polyangiaceae bacterium]|jgi:molecular chaperone DnaK|nr:molecular chaperone DnaK [Polyangiaceae bacterium]
MGRVIGIDLGTTNSCVAVVEGRSAGGGIEAVVIPNAEGARTTPSIVAFAATGERLVGQIAKRQAATNPQRTVHAVKRLMGRKWDEPEVQRQLSSVSYDIVKHQNGDAWVKIDEQQFSAPEISSMVLLAIKETAEKYLGEPVTEAVITVPAYFDEAQRQATKDAGKIAGLDVKRILNEPTAAALAYGLDKNQARRIAVYDLGGGTFDISVLEISSGVFTVKGTGGDTHLGGEDFDVRLIDTLADAFMKAHNIDLRRDRMALQRLREAAEKAKHELSSAHETEVNIPFIASTPAGPLHFERTIKRSELEILTMDLIERTIESCRQVLDAIGISPAQIDDVVLVGGMTRMPAVQRAVKALFGRDAHKGVNPDEVVAAGAAIQAAALAGEIEDVLLLDVAPLSIGVETGGGVFTALIERNTTIPTEKSEVFTTSVDNQTFVPIHVLQGERQMAVDNRSLARFELAGIPPAPRGVPKIQVRFLVDAEGLLSVEAKDLGTGKAHNVVVKPSSGLTDKEIESLVNAAQHFQETDKLRRELAELTNQAESLIYTSEQAIEGYGELLGPEATGEIQSEIQGLRKALDGGGDLMTIRSALGRLQEATNKLANALYGGAT